MLFLLLLCTTEFPNNAGVSSVGGFSGTFKSAATSIYNFLPTSRQTVVALAAGSYCLLNMWSSVGNSFQGELLSSQNYTGHSAIALPERGISLDQLTCLTTMAMVSSLAGSMWIQQVLLLMPCFVQQVSAVNVESFAQDLLKKIKDVDQAVGGLPATCSYTGLSDLKNLEVFFSGWSDRYWKNCYCRFSRWRRDVLS